jgi:hypothetical protein
MPSEDLIKTAGSLVRVIRSPDDIDRARRLERAIDGAGNVIAKPQPFIRLQSEDGSIWRFKVDNTGTTSAVKE